MSELRVNAAPPYGFCSQGTKRKQSHSSKHGDVQRKKLHLKHHKMESTSPPPSVLRAASRLSAIPHLLKEDSIASWAQAAGTEVIYSE